MVHEENKTYACDECGLHYDSADQAERCQEWCGAHGSCNLEITRHSVEVRERAKDHL
ncbi:MAG: hypothetical protein AAB408_00365 [Patescibacteria group bacterium]